MRVYGYDITPLGVIGERFGNSGVEEGGSDAQGAVRGEGAEGLDVEGLLLLLWLGGYLGERFKAALYPAD